MIKNLAFLTNNKISHFIFATLLTILPLSFMLGSLIINSTVVIICILFIYLIFKNKNLNFLKNEFLIILIIFWLSLIINLFFSTAPENGFGRVLGFVRFIILILAIKYFFDFKNNIHFNFIFTSWVLIFLIICFDLIFEFVFGFNTLGFKSYMPGRLSGFLNQELKIGHFFSAFFLICCAYIYKVKPQNMLLYILLFSCLVISLLIGERSNFIRVFLMVIFFIIFFEKKNFIKKILLIFSIFLISLSVIFFNPNYNIRFYGQFIKPIINSENITQIINNTMYGANYDRAFKIFEKNKYFGVGIKNFRNESNKEIYKNKNLKFNEQAATTHPHQIHLEFLSETGLFGYLIFFGSMLYCFFIFIKKYFINRNLISLSAFLYIVFSLVPIIPSGSFFTTFGASLFWINFAIMVSFFDKKN